MIVENLVSREKSFFSEQTVECHKRAQGTLALVPRSDLRTQGEVSFITADLVNHCHSHRQSRLLVEKFTRKNRSTIYQSSRITKTTKCQDFAACKTCKLQLIKFGAFFGHVM